MNKYLAYPKKSQKFYWILLGFFVFFLGYGFYKNGLSYYFLHKMSLQNALVPLLFPVIGVVSSLVVQVLRRKRIQMDVFLKGLMLGLLVPPMFPITWFLLILVLYFFMETFLEKKFPFLSFCLLYKVGLIGFTYLLSIPICNLAELQDTYLYGTLDIFFGRGLGGFGTTHILGIILLYFYLWTDFYYKKELPLYALSIYSVLFGILAILKPDIFLLKNYLNPSIFFAFVLFLPQNESSPVMKKAQVIYGALVGIFSFLFVHFFHLIEGAYLALAIIQILFAVGKQIHFARQK